MLSRRPTPTSALDVYLALGDSLAAGYQPDTTISRDEGYVARVYDELAARDRRLTLRNLGCDGATTVTLMSGGGGCAYRGAASQLAAAEHVLRRHPRQIRLVTIDIGDNDVNPCAAGGVIDQTCALAAVDTVATKLRQIVHRLRAAAPSVRIIGMTYCDPYHAAWLNGPTGQAVAQESMQLTTLLNQRLTAVYTAADMLVADVAGAFATTDLTTTAELPGVGTLPLAVARICMWTWMCAPGGTPDIHPMTTGYEVIATAYLAQTRR